MTAGSGASGLLAQFSIPESDAIPQHPNEQLVSTTSKLDFPQGLVRQVWYQKFDAQVVVVCLSLAFNTSVRFQTLCVSDSYTRDAQAFHDRSATR